MLHTHPSEKKKSSTATLILQMAITVAVFWLPVQQDTNSHPAGDSLQSTV